MKNISYIPERGDIIWLDFNPQSGHEQRGRRPAIVLSPREYNDKVGLALICPITSQIKGYPFEVRIPDNIEINGVIIADQVKSLDWKERNAEFIAKTSQKIILETINKLSMILKP